MIKNERILGFLKATLVTLSMSLAFFVPMIEQFKYVTLRTTFKTAPIQDCFKFGRQLGAYSKNAI